MKIVTNVEIMECTPQHGNTVRLFHNGVFENEVITGQTFINLRGEKIVLGISSIVQETLALPVKYCENILHEIKEIRKVNSELNTVLLDEKELNREIITRFLWANFKQRLKYLFTRKIDHILIHGKKE